MKRPSTKTCFLTLLFIMVWALAGCRVAAKTAARAAPPTAQGAFRVAMLLPRTVDADGWTRSGYEGLLLIKKELGAGIAFSENVPAADFEKMFRQYAVTSHVELTEEWPVFSHSTG